MQLQRLTRAESRIVGEVLSAAADGPFFPDREFHTLFGLYREEFRRIADEWPLPRAAPEAVRAAVNDAFNNLLGYPHRKDDVWPDWIPVDQVALDELFRRLRAGRNDSTVG